jgi:hypothetical protein
MKHTLLYIETIIKRKTLPYVRKPSIIRSQGIVRKAVGPLASKLVKSKYLMCLPGSDEILRRSYPGPDETRLTLYFGWIIVMKYRFRLYKLEQDGHTYRIREIHHANESRNLE